MADLTEAERAYFAPVDTKIGMGSNLLGSAQLVADRVETTTKHRIRHRLDKALDLLWEAKAQVQFENHDIEHEAAPPAIKETCPACLISDAMDLTGEATVL